MLQPLIELYTRDLDNVIKDISAYQNEEDLWKLDGDIKNSAGNLSLHLSGNLLHFIGHQLGGSDYVRDRENEFNAKGTPRKELIEELEMAKSEISRVLSSINASVLQTKVEGFRLDITWEGFLLHLYNHLGYHSGQINYHRRLLAV